MRSQILSLRKEQLELRAENSSMVGKLKSDLKKLEQERDSLSIELEVLRDINGADKASLDKERNRLHEAMSEQQKAHIEKLMEKEDTLHKLEEDFSVLNNDYTNVQNSLIILQSEMQRMEHEQQSCYSQLTALKKKNSELEAERHILQCENMQLRDDNEHKDKELTRLKDVEKTLDKTKCDCESYSQRYQNEVSQCQNLEDQIRELRSQLVETHTAKICTDTEFTALQREYEQFKMSSETAAKSATEHVNRVRRRFENREKELLDALTTADNDVVTAKREVARQKEALDKEKGLFETKEKELVDKLEQSRDAYASLSKSKHNSDTISSQQTSHLQTEISRLLQEVNDIYQSKLKLEAHVADLEERCRGAENNGVHATLSKELHSQVVSMKEEISSLSNDLDEKQEKHDEALKKLEDATALNLHLKNVVRDAEVKIAGSYDILVWLNC